MCRGCLPTKVWLLDKGVTCPTNCASCDSTHEDLLHVFFACPFALQVWHKTGLWGSVNHAVFTTNSATEAIFYLLANLSADLTQRLASAIWSIWKHRNLRVWNDETETSAKVVERALNRIEDWKMATLWMSLHRLLTINKHRPLPPNNTQSSGSLLQPEGINAMLTRLSLRKRTEQLLVFAYVMQKVLLFWLRLWPILAMFMLRWVKL